MNPDLIITTSLLFLDIFFPKLEAYLIENTNKGDIQFRVESLLTHVKYRRSCVYGNFSFLLSICFFNYMSLTLTYFITTETYN